jgi:2-polyprenyl-3-methyl-5-hydroxy-6-metoxy-1,4-benzoquinol methylase
MEARGQIALFEPMPKAADRDRARTYFDRLAPEYDRAFHLQGRNPLDALVNRLFRGPTFVRRMLLLESLFQELRLPGHSVLDLGCGSGQVSLLAASFGAQVHGIDIAPRMLEIARESARRAGLEGRVRFEEGDVTQAPLPEADVTLLVGVIEYYRDFDALVRRAAAATHGTLVIAHARRIFYRMALRHVLFRLQGGRLYVHRMADVVQATEATGLRLRQRIEDHAFSILAFDRGQP